MLAKLSDFKDDEIVIKARPKKIEKGYMIQHPDFRGSRYRGVSKNKGKWQVRYFIVNSELFFNYFRRFRS